MCSQSVYWAGGSYHGWNSKNLEDDGILLQLRNWPLGPKDGVNDLKEVRTRKEAGIVLLEVLDKVVEDEESSWTNKSGGG